MSISCRAKNTEQIIDLVVSGPMTIGEISRQMGRSVRYVHSLSQADSRLQICDERRFAKPLVRLLRVGLVGEISKTAEPTVESDAALDCEGYRHLLADVERDAARDRTRDYRGRLKWAVDRAKHYAEKTGLTAEAILDAWEQRRDYWYMNFYQDFNQPRIQEGKVRIFETVAELMASIGSTGFRCPHCNAVSKSPYECDSGVQIDGNVCDWKVYGFFGHMGKGVAVFVKEKVRVENLFMPVSWETGW